MYGNLPYYITSPILHQLFGYADRIASIHVVMQLEVAERIVARPGHREYGYLSAACQFYTRPEDRTEDSAGRVSPSPESSVRSCANGRCRASARRSGIANEAKFLKFIQLCFGQKRKTLRNNLRTIASDERIHEALASCGLRPDARAEQLSLAHFAALFDGVGIARKIGISLSAACGDLLVFDGGAKPIGYDRS